MCVIGTNVSSVPCIAIIIIMGIFVVACISTFNKFNKYLHGNITALETRLNARQRDEVMALSEILFGLFNPPLKNGRCHECDVEFTHHGITIYTGPSHHYRNYNYSVGPVCGDRTASQEAREIHPRAPIRLRSDGRHRLERSQGQPYPIGLCNQRNRNQIRFGADV